MGFPTRNWSVEASIILSAIAIAYIIATWLVLQFHQVKTQKSTVTALNANRNTTAIESVDAASTTAEKENILWSYTTITLSDCSLVVTARAASSFKKSARTVLAGVNATFEPGKLNFVLGSSGSGKTTLFKLMAQRLRSDWLMRYHSCGMIDLGGENALPMVTYLSQDDSGLIPTLTVRETLYFGAQLRLAKSPTQSSRSEHAEQMIRLLGLTYCADTLVGDRHRKGISGGERRRVSIAMQLLSEPEILVLDEPTSGLDARTAFKILAVLHDLANTHCTVVVALHQPSSNDFQYFDKVLLLAQGGRQAYEGPGREMLPFFDNCGYKCPTASNPADFVLDIADAMFKELVNGETISQQQAVFEHDSADGAYGAEEFLSACTILELPFEFLDSLVVALVATVIIGLPRTKEVFGVVQFSVFALLNMGESIGIIFCALFRSIGFAFSVSNLILAVGSTMSGVFSTKLQPGLREINYLNLGKWPIGGMAPYALRNQTFTCTAAQKDDHGRCPVTDDKDVLALYNLHENGARSDLFLGVLVVGYRLVAYCLLKARKTSMR